MKITNLNSAADIGANSWLAELDGNRLLMDAGIHPKLEGRDALPTFATIGKEEVDAIAITHCHHDHLGALPVAVRHFPRAHILMSELSYFVAPRVLHNSVNVMKRQRDEMGIRDYPLYSHEEVDEIEPLFQGFRYSREIEWAAFHKLRGGAHSPTVEFLDAGHALGSAGLMVRGRKETLFYTGDVCFHDQTILKAAQFDDVEADVLLMETTRGGRKVPKNFSRDAEVDRLAEDIVAVQKRKGSVLIPTFALGRTQEILAILALMMKAGRIKPQPVYIGGLGRVFTEMYDLQAHRTHRQHSSLQLHEALNLVVMDQRQVRDMSLSGSRIFVVTSGMMNENTASHDLAVRILGQERHAIFFVGYADPDTPGGRLKANRPGKSFLFSPSAGEVTQHCEIKDYDLTAHANRQDLLDFVGQVNPSVVMLGHGDEAACQWFAQQIKTRHPKIKIHLPQPGKTIEV